MKNFRNHYKLTLEKNLKELIRHKGMTITFVAKNTGIPIQTIHGWLQGSEPKRITQLKLIADFLRVDLDSLCFGKCNQQDGASQLKEEIYAGNFEVVLRRIKIRHKE